MSIKRVESVIFCDEIRQENNGKLLAIGIYPEIYLVPSFPFTGQLALLLTLNMEDIAEKEVMFFDILPEGETQAQANFRFEIAVKDSSFHKSARTIIQTPQLPFSIASAGNLLFREKTENGNVLQQFTLYVDRQPAPTA